MAQATDSHSTLEHEGRLARPASMRHAATQNVNRLFEEAAKTWSPPAATEATWDADGSSGALPGDTAPALLGPSATPAVAAALVGKRVRIHGLATAAELNRQYGEVRAVADGERVVVQLDG